MSMDEISPELFIEDSYLDEYKRQVEELWRELLNLNTYLFYIERLEDFRFDLFSNGGKSNFWQLIKNALLEACISTIYRTAIDNDPKSLTLRRLKNNIFQHRSSNIHEDADSWLKQNIANVEFEKRLAKFEGRIRQIRHRYYGHLNYDAHVNTLETTPDALYLDELQEVYQLLSELFNTLAFNRYGFWYWNYSEGARESRTTDLDSILDLVAQHSHLLNAPERNPDLWKLIRKDMPLKKIELLNYYRRKFGLPQIE